MERLENAPPEINEHYADIIDFSLHMPGCRYNGDNPCTCFAKERLDELMAWAIEAEVRELREALTSVSVCSGDHCVRCRETLARAHCRRSSRAGR